MGLELLKEIIQKIFQIVELVPATAQQISGIYPRNSLGENPVNRTIFSVVL
jgi:hypothetical protein